MGRTNEVQVQQFGIGGDFHYDNVRGRLMTQFGMYSTQTPRNDASPGRGQWDLADAYRYLSEAYGGYHFDVMHGINVDVGIFMSYIGLFSYYNSDNWAYQPSYVSSNTPWFFNGMRVQTFPSDKLKIEYWLINGWQSYGMFNHQPGFGTEILWRPTGSLLDRWQQLLRLRRPGRAEPDAHPHRQQLPDEVLRPARDFWNKSAFSFTVDAGCESGGRRAPARPETATDPDAVLPGLHGLRPELVHARPLSASPSAAARSTIPGATSCCCPRSTARRPFSGTPYFTTNPGNQFQAWDGSVTFDYMPSQYFAYVVEFEHREASVPYFAGRGGMTPPGGNQGLPGSTVPGWFPQLVRTETRLNFAILRPSLTGCARRCAARRCAPRERSGTESRK